MFQFIKRFFGSYSAYQPGTGRIVAVNNNSTSGINITPDTAMTIPTIFHGVRLYGQTLGMLHWDVIHHTNGSTEIERTHPVHRLLHDEPNEFQTAPEFRELLVGNAIGYGNGIAYIERNGNFRPTALWPLMPDRTEPQVKDGKLIYKTVVNGKGIDLEPYEVFHLKGFSGSAISGYPLWMLMRDTLGLSKAEAEFAALFFGSGANMGGVVEMSGALSDKARQNLKSSMAREYGGLGNAFKTLFLEEGMKFSKTAVNPQEGQFIEGRQFNITELARVLGLAPHLLYDLSRSTNNNIEHQGIEAVTYSFGPLANRLCKEANRKLLYESEKNEYETRIDLKPLMQGDAMSQAQVDQIRFNTLSITPDEIRAKDGRNPIEGGDSLYINSTYLPLHVAIAKASLPAPADNAVVEPNEPDDVTEDIENDNPPADTSAGVKDPDGQPGPKVPANLIDDDLGRSAVLMPIVRDAVSRILRRESKIIETASNKHGRDSEAFRQWFASFEVEQRSHIGEVLQPVREAMAAVGLELNGYVDTHLTESRAALTTPIEQGDRIENAVQHILKGTVNGNS